MMRSSRAAVIGMMAMATLMVFVSMGSVTPASAQTRAWSGVDPAMFPRLSRKATSELWVYQDDEPRHGLLLRLTEQDLTLLVDDHEETIPLSSIRRVDRHGDTIWNGFAMGGAVGVVEWMLLTRGTNADLRAGAYLVGFSALIGAGIDALWVGETTVYQSPTRPIVTDSPRRGPFGPRMRLSWTFKF